LVDVLLSVSPISSPLESVTLGSESSAGTSEFEGPEEVVGFLEVGTDGVDLVDEVIDGGDVVLTEDLLDGVVGLEGDSLLVDLAVTSLEHESLDGFSGGVPVGDVGLHSPEHIDGGLVDADEDTVVELSQSQQSHDPDDLGVQLVDTSDSHDEGELGVSGYVDLPSGLGLNSLFSTVLMASISARTDFW
jgi:hypothetical protein